MPEFSRREWLEIAAGAAAALALPARAAPGPLRIGAILELSGPASVFVRSERESIEMALDDLNRKGIGGSKVELVAYDNESNETKSLVLAKRLVEQDGVVGIIGA